MKKKTAGGYYRFDDAPEPEQGFFRYSTGDCLKYMIRFSRQSDKWIIPMMILAAGAFSGVELLWALLNKYVVDLALSGGTKERLIAKMGVIVAAILMMKLINGILCDKVCQTKFRKCRYLFARKLYQKQMDTDYENLEKPAVKTLFEGAKQSIDNLIEFYYRVQETAALAVSLLGWSAVIVTLSPWLIAVILVPTIVYYYIVKYKIVWYNRHVVRWLDIDRKMEYVKRKSADFANAKDIRLYHMKDWLGALARKFIDRRLFWYKKQAKVEGLNGFFQLLIVSIRDIAAYGFIVWNMARGGIGAGNFILYFSSVGQIAYAFYHIMDHIASFGWITAGVSRYREFLEVEDCSNRGKGAALPKGNFEIRFEKVCYRYGGAESDTIRDLSFTIRSGEKIAIVGGNGAGKTTIVKLLCGIYRRTGGEIYIGDRSIDAYNRDELFRLYATVFQDIHVMPSTITQNIVMSGAADLKALSYAAERSGLMDKINELPDGLDTYLVKSVYDDATDLSGGERQKLALARALYKQKTCGSGVLLLDEPTAALDPIAEQNMYQEYARFAQGNISVFISHRLASTQFCDRIFYLKDGQIAECGTHKELLEAGGEYAHIFEVQGRYYRQKEVIARAFEEKEACYE